MHHVDSADTPLAASIWQKLSGKLLPASQDQSQLSGAPQDKFSRSIYGTTSMNKNTGQGQPAEGPQAQHHPLLLPAHFSLHPQTLHVSIPAKGPNFSVAAASRGLMGRPGSQMVPCWRSNPFSGSARCAGVSLCRSGCPPGGPPRLPWWAAWPAPAPSSPCSAAAPAQHREQPFM